MATVNNDIDTYNSIMLNLETLMAEYENTLAQYNQARADYAAFLQNIKTSSQLKSSLSQIKGMNYWGTSRVGSQPFFSVTNPDQCQAMCSNFNGCFAATYSAPTSQSTSARCYLVAGESSLVAGQPNDYAIVPTYMMHVKKLNELNNKLIGLYQQIIGVMNDTTFDFSGFMLTQLTKNETTLNDEYEKLMEQKAIIKHQLRELEELENQNDEWHIYTTQNYYWYLLLLLIAIVIIIIFIIISYGFNKSSTNIVGGKFR